MEEKDKKVQELEKHLDNINDRLYKLEVEKEKKYQFAKNATKFLCDNSESVFLIAVLVIANLYIWSNFE